MSARPPSIRRQLDQLGLRVLRSGTFERNPGAHPGRWYRFAGDVTLRHVLDEYEVWPAHPLDCTHPVKVTTNFHQAIVTTRRYVALSRR